MRFEESCWTLVGFLFDAYGVLYDFYGFGMILFVMKIVVEVLLLVDEVFVEVKMRLIGLSQVRLVVDVVLPLLLDEFEFVPLDVSVGDE